MEKTAGIYVITNTVNNKKYVGSSKYLLRRISEHQTAFKYNKHHNAYLQASVNKYGIDSFTFNILEYVEDTDKLEEREEYWCKLLGTHVSKYGFNIAKVTRSGPISEEYRQSQREQCEQKQRIYMLNSKGRIINVFESIAETSRVLNTSQTNLWYLLTKKGLYKKNFMFFRGLTFTQQNINTCLSKRFRDNKHCFKPVYQFDSNKTLISTYTSRKEALLKNPNILGITDALRNNRPNGSQQAGDYFWTYNPQGPSSYTTLTPVRLRPVSQYTLEGTLLATFPSIVSAANTTGFKKKGIEKVLYGECKTYKGFLWK